ncbi:hypothetical protein V8E55_011847 [Tylopilus felleus]
MAPLNCDSPIPKDWIYGVTVPVSHQFASSTGTRILQSWMTLEGLCEANWMVDQLVLAYHQKVVIDDADILRLAERAGTFAANNVEVLGQKKLLERFPDATELAFHGEPSVIVDQSDNIVLWYLPTAVSGPNQGGQSVPKLSALLKPARSLNGIRDWLQETREQVVILSGALAIMHLDMYHTGREALVRLGRWAASAEKPEISEILAVWPSVYNIASIMAN